MPFEPVKYSDAKSFISETKQRLVDAFSGKKGFGYVSGGVDSTTGARLIVDALGEANFTSINFDHGGMRKGEPKEVLFSLNKDCGVPTIFRDYSGFVLDRVIKAGPDADEKRKYGVSGSYFPLAIEESKKLNASWWFQGTIWPDVVETVDSKLKRQHNVILEEQKIMFNRGGVEIVEPLLYLYKNQVREVAKELGLPEYISDRKPFPGPGLYCRAVGQVSREKMDALREADNIVMGRLENYTKQFAKEDFQCLCSLIDNNTADVNIPELGSGSRKKMTVDKVTGMVNNQRTYTNMLLFDPDNNLETQDLIDVSPKIVNENFGKGIGRVAYLVGDRGLSWIDRRKYIAVLRSVLTKDFTKADATPISRDHLNDIANDLLELGPQQIGEVYYDVTPKPPATIEFE